MELFKHDATVDFMGARYITAAISLGVLLLSLAALGYYGLQWGLDFTGGTQIEVHFNQTTDLSKVRKALSDGGFPEAIVQSYGSTQDVVVSIAPRENLDQTQLAQKVLTLLPKAEKRRIDFVGPQVGNELATKGILAILVSLIATMIYIAIRFEYRFAVSSATALIHDPLLILGVFAWLHIEFDLKALAALLAVIGYSLNDTIVVFDRVRENFRKVRGANTVEIMNLSINQTLSRTIMTSALTLMVVVVLFFYGGEAIHGFSLALIIGIVIGTYSSIYVAGALAVAMGLDRADFIPSKKADLDHIP